MTADLLSVWTDPDTAMHAVGTSLAALDEQPSRLDDELYDVLLDLVDRGELEKRALSDGRFAFRWRDNAEPDAVSTDAESARLVACLAATPRRTATLESAGAGPQALVLPAPRRLPRIVVLAVPLVVPAASCLLVLLALVWFGRRPTFAVAAVCALAGLIGLARRVPFAAFWTAGVALAIVLLWTS
jgi:hypothetical protein